MKLTNMHKTILISFALVPLMMGMDKLLPDDPEVKIPATVIGKVMAPRSKSQADAILVYRYDDGRVDESSVTYASYVQLNAGDRIVFTRHASEISPTWGSRMHIIYSLIGIFGFMVGCVATLLFFPDT